MKKNKYILPILSALCVLSLVAMTVILLTPKKEKSEPTFTPPPFEAAAQSGMPEVSDESWTKVYQDGMSFTAYVCGKVSVKEGKADLYFTSDGSNNVWLKLRVTDEKDNILGETGLLKPGEYVKSIEFDTVPKSGTKIKLKIMAYEPETYYSAGAVALNTTVGG